jgi:hypothetical protein
VSEAVEVYVAMNEKNVNEMDLRMSETKIEVR